MIRFELSFGSKNSVVCSNEYYYRMSDPYSIPVCYWQIDLVSVTFHFISFSTDFSLEEWKYNLDISTESLLPALTDQLMEHLGIAGYLSTPQCTLAGATASGWIDGWYWDNIV